MAGLVQACLAIVPPESATRDADRGGVLPCRPTAQRVVSGTMRMINTELHRIGVERRGPHGLLSEYRLRAKEGEHETT